VTSTQNCPCGSEKTLAQCCQPYISGKSKPKTAEALLRARYTAFTLGETDYIVNTHHTKTRKDVDRKEIESWSKNSKWEGLEILQIEAGTESDKEGKIVFHAKYRGPDKKMVDHWEQSLFEKEGNEWRFMDAQGVKPAPIQRDPSKQGRNDPCACGSGKKFKKCCAQQSASA
jgi:SEC-C motif-containing protein